MNSHDRNDRATTSAKPSSRWSPTALLKRLGASLARGIERAYRDRPPYSEW